MSTTTCKHRPISNGWSQSWTPDLGYTPAITWCGYCRAVAEVDQEWIDRFVTHGKVAPHLAGSDFPTAEAIA